MRPLLPVAPRPFVATLVACLLLLVACPGPQLALPAPEPSLPPVRDYWPTEGWRSDASGNHGLDEAKLAGIRAQITGIALPDSLLIVKDGYLVFEEYFNGYDVMACIMSHR